MATKEPLKANTLSNLPRPGGDIPKPTGLQRPSGLKPPTSGLKPPTSGLKPPTTGLKPLTTGLKPLTTGLKPPTTGLKPPSTGLKPPSASGLKPPSKMIPPSSNTTGQKRAASPTKDDRPVAKRTRVDAPQTRAPPSKPAVTKRAGIAPPQKVTKPTITKPGPRPAPTAAVKGTVKSTAPAKTKPAVTRPGARAPASKAAPAANKNTAVSSKRPAWDYKGRLQDMEGALSDFVAKNEETTRQVARLMAERQELQGEIAVKTEITTKTSQEITQLETKIRNLEDELSSSRRQLQQEISDLEFSKSRLERQRDTLEGELRASQQEAAGLKSSIATITASNAGLKAELDNTKLNLEQSLEAGRMKDSTIAQLRETIAKHEGSIRDLNEGAREHETERRKLHNMVQELKGNIRVFCRVRPLLGDERLGNDGEISHMSFPDSDNKVLELEKVGDLPASETLGNVPKNGKKYEFSFDQVFGPDASQACVFDEISQLVQSALDGYNVCIFAYGQTGSGKTFTMEGPEDKTMEEGEGMIPRAVKQIFLSASALTDKDWEYDFEASFLEIYNESIRDLLGDGKEDTKHEVKMVSKDSNETMVTNLTTVKVTTQNQVHQLLAKAAQNRAVAETKCNERSSRSHSVFRLRLSGVNHATSEKCVGNLNLIDLAGSERLKESGSQGARLKETQCINKSLANLGNVIMALANKDPHVPYRNSKLTHLLQHSLGGNSKTLMFVNVNPREDFMGETLCSLRFATKVNSCHIGTAQKRIK